jgi:hypothetical protein
LKLEDPDEHVRAVARQAVQQSVSELQELYGRMSHVREAPRPNFFLSTVGVILLGVAAVGFFAGRNPELCGGFLIVGAALSIASVVVTRMEGPQELNLTGAKLNLAKAAIQEGEAALNTTAVSSVHTLEEVMGRANKA